MHPGRRPSAAERLTYVFERRDTEHNLEGHAIDNNAALDRYIHTIGDRVVLVSPIAFELAKINVTSGCDILVALGVPARCKDDV